MKTNFRKYFIILSFLVLSIKNRSKTISFFDLKTVVSQYSATNRIECYHVLSKKHALTHFIHSFNMPDKNTITISVNLKFEEKNEVFSQKKMKLILIIGF